MPKKILILFLAAAVLFLASCGGEKAADPEDKTSIVCTVFPAYDFARSVIGNSGEFDLKLLLKPGSEVHSFEPTPQDIINIKNCDIFIYNGGESDEWAKNILESIDTKDMKIIAMMDCVETVEEETVEGMQKEDDEKDEEPQYDEHVWTSPVNASKIARVISESIIETAEENRNDTGLYKQNTEEYLAKLSELDQSFRDIINNSKRKTIVFGDRFPFRYFAEEYGLDYYAAFPGCSAETEADAKTVAFLIDKVNSEQIPVVFYPELSNQKVALTICESTNAEPRQLNSCHNLTVDEFKSGADYLSLMKENLAAIEAALN